MMPEVYFQPPIDSSTLKHLVTDVPDPPKPAREMYLLQQAGKPQQQNISVSSRTLKHIVTDVPDPPEAYGSAYEIYKSSLHYLTVNSKTLKHLVTDVPDPPEDYGSASKIYESSLHFTDIFSKNQNSESKSKVLPQKSMRTTSPWNTSVVLLGLSLFLPIVICDDHMLSYHHTGLYYPEEGRYHFETVGYVDDQEIDMYSSESQVNIPKTTWMEQNEDDDYWERQTSLRRGWEKVFKDNLMILASRFNHTSRFYTLQLSYGCVLYDDDDDDDMSTGYYQYGFDGKDFLIFHSNTLLWIPSMQKAEISAQRWNSDRIIGEGVKLYLSKHCTSALRKYITYGREELEKRVRPEVKVWGRRQSDGVTRLQCLVYGFHPRAVDVKWVRNGVDHLPSEEMTPILPHPDGTYQIKVTADVPTTEGDTYSCYVDHSSLEEILNEKWDPESDLGIMVPVIAIIVIAVVVLLLVVVIVFVLKQKLAPKTGKWSFLLRRSPTSSDRRWWAGGMTLEL